MKLSIVILVLVGIVAALAAAVLVGALRADNFKVSGVTGKQSDVTIVVARKDLPAQTPIDEKSIEVRTVPRDHAPPGALSDSSQVVGKVLVISLAAGQPITSSSFAQDGSGVQLASQLPPGMRAVSVNVTDASGLYGILYPGSNVDVLVAVKRSRTDELSDTISTTLLENVPVLGVEQFTIVTPDNGRKLDGENAVSMQSRVRKVTLMVNMQQAKALQLAQDVGVISLAMRNPLDKEHIAGAEPVTLRLIAGMPEPLRQESTPALTIAAVTPEGNVAGMPAPRNVETPVAEHRPLQQWKTTVIRGTTVETSEFPMPVEPAVTNERN